VSEVASNLNFDQVARLLQRGEFGRDGGENGDNPFFTSRSSRESINS
jgi:hypothetical protein